jgi:hypothetical protein
MILSAVLSPCSAIEPRLFFDLQPQVSPRAALPTTYSLPQTGCSPSTHLLPVRRARGSEYGATEEGHDTPPPFKAPLPGASRFGEADRLLVRPGCTALCSFLARERPSVMPWSFLMTSS